MHVHTRSAYRWDGKKIDPDVVRQNEEQLDRLLHQARARNAARRVEPLEEWPSAARDVVWRPQMAEGAKTRRGRVTTTFPKSEKARGAWLVRSVMWVLLLAMAGVACLPFGGDVVRIATAVL